MPNIGICHVHSTYSHDGRHTLSEIIKFAKERNYRFVGMAEHSDSFNKAKMKEFVSECRGGSDNGFVLLSGIEFSCHDNFHLIGLGITEFTESKDPVYVAKFIKEQGGLAILAHPSRYSYKIPELLGRELNGIEIWNVPYDGRFVPNIKSINLFNSLKHKNKTLVAFPGQDLHLITNHSQIKIALSNGVGLSEEHILTALKHGEFTFNNNYFEINSTNGPNGVLYGKIFFTWYCYKLAKGIRSLLTNS